MNCYKCNTEMKKQVKQDVLIDACPTCKGVWLDAGELEMLAGGKQKSKDEILSEAKREIIRDKGRLMVTCEMCPKCQIEPLAQKFVEGVELDYCRKCGGLYFDWSELEKVLARKASSEKGTFKSFFSEIFRTVRS